jgi:hypothetical protein
VWYVRVAGVAGFLRQVAPELEARLADTALASHSGTLALSFHRAGSGSAASMAASPRSSLGRHPARGKAGTQLLELPPDSELTSVPLVSVLMVRRDRGLNL